MYSAWHYPAMMSTPRPVSGFERAVAAQLRSEIAVSNITKSSLAEAVGVHRTHLSRVINGRTHIDLDLLAAICNELGVDIVQVLKNARASEEEPAYAVLRKATAEDDESPGRQTA